MLNFFRKKRKKNANENRPLKYFRYAVGEIVLVVIGILIALQINTWNEGKKNSKKEFYLLQQLQKEFKKDSSNISTHAWLTNLKVEDGKLIKSFLKGKFDIRTDSLASMLMYTGKVLIFQSHTPTYDEIISSGNLSLLRSEELKTKISNFKSNISHANSFLFLEAHAHKERYNSHIFKYFDSEIISHLWRNGNRRSDRMIKSEALKNFYIDVEGFKNDPNSLYHVRTLIGVDAELNFQYTERMNLRINEILELLRVEIRRFEK